MLEQQSDFEKWRAEHGGRTTLEQEVELARQLADEILGPECGSQDSCCVAPPSLFDVEEIVAQLRRAGSRNDNGTLMTLTSSQAVHVGWFRNVFCAFPFVQRLREFGCEMWFVRKVAILEMIRRTRTQKQKQRSMSCWCLWRCGQQQQEQDDEQSIVSGPFVDHVDAVQATWKHDKDNNDDYAEFKSFPILSKASTFVSYTDRCSLDYFLNAVRQLDEDEYMWLDIFSVNQFSLLSPSLQLKESFLDEMQSQLKTIQHISLVPEPYGPSVVSALENNWILWQVCEMAEAGGSLRVLPQQRGAIEAEYFQNPNHFDWLRHAISSVDAFKIDPSDPLVLSRLQSKGLDHVNSLVIAQMQAWLTEITETYLLAQRQQGKDIKWKFLNQLAELLQDQGYSQDVVDPLLEEALELQRVQLGDEHPLTLATMEDLGCRFYAQGKLKDAEPLLQGVLAGQEKTLGSLHRKTLASLCQLTTLYRDLGKLGDAESSGRDALTRSTKVYGDQHPDTLRVKNNLAALYFAQRKFKSAERMLRDALDSSRQLWGSLHPDTLSTMNSLGLVLKTQGKFAEAEPLYEEALDGRRLELGHRHPSTIDSMQNLALLYEEQGKLAKALALQRQAWEGRKKLLGEYHPDTLESMFHLCVLLTARERLDEARSLVENTLAGCVDRPEFDESCHAAADSRFFKSIEALEMLYNHIDDLDVVSID